MPRAMIYLYQGAEMLEAFGTLDILRRCEIEVVTVAKTAQVQMNFNLQVKVSKVLPHCDLYDAIIIPGGPGWENVQDDHELRKMVDVHVKAGKLVCAICAAPSVTLGRWGYLNGKKATCYPGMQTIGLFRANFCDSRVVTDGNFVTSRAPGTTLEFAFAIAQKLGCPTELVESVKAGTLYRDPNIPLNTQRPQKSLEQTTKTLKTMRCVGIFGADKVSEQEANELFELIDINFNNFVEKSEIRLYLREQIPHIEHAAITEAFKKSDGNDDGFLDIAEFKRFLKCLFPNKCEF